MSEATDTAARGSAQAIITLNVTPENVAQFTALESRIGAACQAFPGFISGETIHPVAGIQEHWVIRIAFDTPEHLNAWLESEARQQLVAELAPLLADGREERTLAAPPVAAQGVTILLHTRPQAGKETEYGHWQEGINAAAAAFPGFQQARVFAPHPPYQPEWSVAYSFDTAAHLQAWLDSDARREWLARGQPLFEQTSERRLAGGFANWFAPDVGGGPVVPAGWKQVMAVLLALYPTVMLLSLSLGPLLKPLPAAAAMFVSNLASCTLLQYGVMRLVNRGFGFWLSPAPAQRERATLVGTALVIGCYVVFLAIFLAIVR